MNNTINQPAAQSDAALKADAERYRWLRTKFTADSESDRFEGYRWWTAFYDKKAHKNIDAAIDAARSGNG